MTVWKTKEWPLVPFYGWTLLLSLAGVWWIFIKWASEMLYERSILPGDIVLVVFVGFLSVFGSIMAFIYRRVIIGAKKKMDS